VAEAVEDQGIVCTEVNSDHIALNLDQSKTTQECENIVAEEPEKIRKSIRIALFSLVIIVLFVGRFSVPDIEVPCVQDKVMEALEFANKFINQPGNEIFRDIFQFVCSLMVDTVFIITFGYWVLFARTARLPLTMAVFYIVRAIVQKLWMSPFPEGFYWESPGIPSFVVPYGRGSDFFFSGHSGFLVLMANEWDKWGYKRFRNYILVNLVYTIFILMVYQAHYSIDVFTGVFYADYVYGKIDAKTEVIDDFVRKLAYNVQKSAQNYLYSPNCSAPEKLN